MKTTKWFYTFELKLPEFALYFGRVNYKVNGFMSFVEFTQNSFAFPFLFRGGGSECTSLGY